MLLRTVQDRQFKWSNATKSPSGQWSQRGFKTFRIRTGLSVIAQKESLKRPHAQYFASGTNFACIVLTIP